MDDPSFPGKKVFDYRSDYPQRYTARGGPVPLISSSRLVPLTGLLPAKCYVAKHAEYAWKFNEMRFSILAARVVSLSNIRKVPLTCSWTSSLKAIKALQPRGSTTFPPSTVVRRSPLGSSCLQSSSGKERAQMMVPNGTSTNLDASAVMPLPV